MKPRILLLFTVFICSKIFAQNIAQDTIKLQLPQAQKMFLDSNLQLLAQKYSVDASKALVTQARLFPNPNISIGEGLYSGTEKQFIFGKGYESNGSISQLVYLAGKRNKQVKLAEANVKLNEYQFNDLLRTLKYVLRTDFFNIYYLQSSAKVYITEIKALQQTVDAIAFQQEKGYISKKEAVRIQAQLYSFKNEYNELLAQISDIEGELKLLIKAKANVFIVPQVDSIAINKLTPTKYPLTVLIDSAYHNRTDLLIAETNTDISKLNYKLQKSLQVPDLTLNAGFDKAGGFENNFYGVGFSIDLPIFNRNQGNVRSAKAMIANSEALQKNTVATVEENVSRSLQKALAREQVYRNIDTKFISDFEQLSHEVLQSYQKRNMNMIEFLDFYDSYKQSILQINAIKFNRIQALEDINFYTATNFFN
jgi:cobalt-zinc-cadmium efflux system outer membrane protein